MDKLIRNVALYTYDPHHNEGNLLRRDVDSTAAAVETTTFEAALSNNLNSVKTLYIPFPLSFLPELFFKIQKKFWNVYIPRVKFNISTFPFSLLLLPFFLFLNIQRYVYNTSLRSIVHIKRISCPSSPTFNVQPSPLSNAGYRRRLTFHGRYSTTQLLLPLEFIPPSLAPLLRSYSKFREIERGWKEEKEREKKLETRRKGGGRAWLEATIGIEIRCMGAGGEETVLLLVFICGATEISALQLTRTISGGRYFNGSQRLRAYTVQCAPMCFATGFSPLSNVRHKCIFYLRIYSFASSFFFPLSSILSRRNSKLVLFSTISISISPTNNEEKWESFELEIENAWKRKNLDSIDG